MSKNIPLRKGLDINLQGAAETSLEKLPLAKQYALSPLDFEGVTPKLLVKVGDKVEAGSPLFYNKADERIIFTSPVSGTVSAINRGEKRKILSVVVDADSTQTYKEFPMLNTKSAKREEIVEMLLNSGLWSMLIARPYGIIADPNQMPKAIFVSTFDSAPLAPDYNFVLSGELSNIQKGVEVLGRLTEGKVHFGARQGAASPLSNVAGVETTTFSGKHPIGNVGTQIHHIDPINKGEVVWTINIQDLAIVGRLFSTGKVDMTKIVAVAGSEVTAPKYYQIISGAPVSSMLKGGIKEQKENEKVRVISGNVLTGTKISEDAYITFYANMITVIPEGDTYELLGWIMPRFNKFSVSRSYFSWICPKKQYRLDANLNGGERPFIMSDVYEKYLPMDILPVYLIKAILAGDIDKMENLGIYEVIEEDLALCEFVDPSKINMQQILRDGINLMIKEA
ncbi:MAG: Na(+)-translocating NADH-quinone reductase subunit A [Rikenellaceae bacterium]